MLFMPALLKVSDNRASPLLSRHVRVVTKRQHVSGSRSGTRTRYYVTFEFTDGSREELSVTGGVYGQIAEGDRGTLHSQGTWYKRFERFLDTY
jgi:hypothetical protein